MTATKRTTTKGVILFRWMLEVGAEAEPCAGPGTLARLHLPSDAALETVVEALASTPGVAFVEHPDNRRLRRWLVGAEIDELARLGREAAASGASWPAARSRSSARRSVAP